MKMGRKVVVGLFILLWVIPLLLASGCASTTQLYIEKFGVSVEYPTKWTVCEEVYPADRGTTVTFSMSDYPLTGMVLMLWAMDDDFYFNSLEDFYYRGVVAPWEDSDGFKILSERRILIQGLPAKEVLFEYLRKDVIYRSAIVALLDTRVTDSNESNAIKMIYHAPLNNHKSTYPAFEKLVESFKFTGEL